MVNGTRKRIVRLLWAIVILIVFGIGFAPVYVASKNAETSLRIQCQNERNNIEQLQADKLKLQALAEIAVGQRLIASDLGLPVAQDLAQTVVEIDMFIEDFKIPEVAPECEELSQQSSE